jgi:NAD(P)-dependent dehydrogenase (short-subunit alcohol dehydrogenase family)
MSDRPRSALVTGGAQGIGKAIALRLLADGWQVTALDADSAAAAAAQSEFGEPGRAVVEAVDVGDEPAVRAAVDRHGARHDGRMDALFNVAGVMVGAHPEQLALDDWERVLRTNLTGAFLCARTAAPLLRAGRGAIVNVASTRALMSEPGSEAYAASKGGLCALTHALAISLGPEIRVNAILPGWIDVSGWGSPPESRTPEHLTAEDHAQHPAGRVGRPEDVAALAAWLAGPEAGFVTGAEFTLDGGMTRKMIYA